VLPNPFDDRPEQVKTKAATTYAILIVANVAAWAWAWLAFADRPTLLGTALLAYMFGLRHAFDADHIAAIDNVVRKLMQDGKRPYSAGFFFSLGHSTVVILASIVIAAATAAVRTRLAVLHDIGGVIGTAVSALFLLIIGVANLFVLGGVWTAFARARRGGAIAPEDIDGLLAGQGVLTRLFRPLFSLVSRSWRMYPIGFLFGLGFDTATEIGVLGIAATQAAQGLSPWTILVFPALFTAGMSMMDTSDSVLMTGAYGWAFITPIRKLWYNLTITAASVAVAIFIGGLEALELVGDKLGLKGAVWRAIGDLNGNLANFGYVVVGIFIVSWIVSALVYRARGFDNLRVSQR
jgi:high-affinity nickel-transport protein